MESWTTEHTKILVRLNKKFKAKTNKWKLISQYSKTFSDFYEKDNSVFTHKLKAYEKENKKDSYRSLYIKCPECSSKLSHNHLLNIGLWCPCNVKTELLIKALEKFVWIVYIFQNKKYTSLLEPIEYVGYSTDIVQRMNTHRPKYFNDSNKIRISLILGETTCINLFKPKYNNTSIGKNNVRIKTGTMWKTHELPYMETEKSNVLKLIKNPEEQILKYYESQDWCYDFRYKNCVHKVKCPLRSFINPYLGKDRWYPIDSSLLTQNTNTESKTRIRPVNLNLPVKSPHMEDMLVRKTGLSENTIKMYITTYNEWVKKEILEYLKYPELFISELWKYYSLKTLEKHTSVVWTYITLCTEQEKLELFGNKKNIKMYQDIKMIIDLHIRNIKESGIKNSKEKENWVEYTDLLKVVEYYKSIKLKNVMNFQKYFISLLYTKQNTLRNDFPFLKIKEYTENDNYIDLKNNLIHINLIKVGTQKNFVLNEELKNAVEEFVELYPERKELFLMRTNEPYKEDSFSKLIIKTFSDGLEKTGLIGKRVGIQMIRKIVATERNKELSLPGELAIQASAMGHSVDMNKNYYTKH